MSQALLDGLSMTIPCKPQTTLSGSHYYYPHSIEEEIETERLSNLPKVTQLGSCELGLEPRHFDFRTHALNDYILPFHLLFTQPFKQRKYEFI